MGLRWIEDGRTGQALRGMDAQDRYVAQVVAYDRPTGWVAYVRGRKGQLRHESAEAAMASAERALAATVRQP